jgi:hypothetical protein
LVDLTQSPYGYVNGNPLQLVDPLGLLGWNPIKWSKDDWADVAMVAGAVATVATLAAATVATGGMAAVVVGAVATGATTLSLGSSVMSTGLECSDGRPAGACVESAAMTGIGFATAGLSTSVSGSALRARHLTSRTQAARGSEWWFYETYPYLDTMVDEGFRNGC